MARTALTFLRCTECGAGVACITDAIAIAHGTDGSHRMVRGLMIERDEARAALSRAEETIEKFNQLRLKLNADADYLVTKASLGRRIHTILTEYECSAGRSEQCEPWGIGAIALGLAEGADS